MVLTAKGTSAAASSGQSFYRRVLSGVMSIPQFLIKTRRIGAGARKATRKEIRRHRIAKFYKEHCGYDMKFFEPDDDEENCLKEMEAKEMSLAAEDDPLALLQTMFGDDESSEPLVESFLSRLFRLTDQDENSDGEDDEESDGYDEDDEEEEEEDEEEEDDEEEEEEEDDDDGEDDDEPDDEHDEGMDDEEVKHALEH